MRAVETHTMPHVVGREGEISRIESFLADRSERALVLDGEAGAGKTTLWEAGVEAARGRGLRVLSARPSGAEAGLSFAGLTDLLEDVRRLPSTVPAPQRHALEIALLRAAPDELKVGPRTIATGLLNVLRALARRKTVLVAIDDVQWLDRSSGEALAFVARRVEAANVRFLLAKRSGPQTPLEAGLAPAARLQVTPLSLGAIRALLFARLGLSPPRRVLRQLFEASGGNPLFALELGRLVAERGVPEIGEDMPVPDEVEALVGTRVGRLPPRARRLLLAVALSPELGPEQLAGLASRDDVEHAVEDGLLVLDAARVRPSHPLLAAAARKRSRAHERRELHRELAGLVSNESLQARHLALAADRPDAALAETIAAAAEGAAARGAREEAVELAEHALRLTPHGDRARSERLLALAAHLETAGEYQRMTELLESELPSIPAGTQRARAWLQLSEGTNIQHLDDYRRHLERALAEARDDPALHARVVAKMSSAVISVERIEAAETAALDVLPAAQRAGPEVERAVLFALAWARGLRGRPVDEMCEQWAAASPAPGFLAESPERIAGQRLVWRGSIDAARDLFSRMIELAAERGEPASTAWARLHLCELALRAGELGTASQLLDEWEQSSEAELFVNPTYQRCRALLAAGRGLREEAEKWSAETIARTEEIGTQWDWLEGLRARGIAAALAHDPTRTAESLRLVWEHTEREGVADPGVFPVAPDLVEALVELAEVDEALEVTERLAALAAEQDHPWGLATAARCRALVRLGAGAHDEAAAGLREAAEAYASLGLLFDRARTLLALGRGERRLKKWGAARKTLEQAAALFDGIGATGWAGQARADLARVGGRPRERKESLLTKTEARVAELAAEGLSNKEIARTLFVTIHTVEMHLTRVYAKLGIRSRSQLASRLAAPNSGQ